MLKRTITYKDYDGEERTEDYLFNLSEAELTEMELKEEGGLVKKLERIVAAKDGTEIAEIFKELILKSYGEKSPDGKRFDKSAEVTENFMYTPAYSIIYMELITDDVRAAAFVEGIIPKVKE